MASNRGSVPQPYYEDDAVTIYHGDCHSVLRDVGSFDVDLLLTDPPYGIAHKIDAGGLSRPGRHQGETVVGDDEPFDPRWLLPLARKSVIFGANYFAHLLPPSGWVIWSKVQDNCWAHGPASTRSLAEVAWTNAHRHVALFNCYWPGTPVKRKGEEHMVPVMHPTQKPLELMRWLVGRYTKPRELILDPYMGSGPIAKAARDLGRFYVGIEIEERYCEAAVGRLGQQVMELSA